MLGESTAHNTSAIPAKSAKRAGQKDKGSEKDRLRALQGTHRPASTPARLDGDMTGMTGLLETPVKGGEYGTIDKNGNVGGEASGKCVSGGKR